MATVSRRADRIRQDASITITVNHPGSDPILLRTERDWERDIAPVKQDPKRGVRTFKLPADSPHLYYKAIVQRDGDVHWAKGPNMLAVSSQPSTLQAYPYFDEDDHCSVCALDGIDSTIMGHRVKLRVFLPPGYHENTLRDYPVLYMNDGQNLFFPAEAAFGEDWKIRETLSMLSEMNQIDPLIVVGVFPEDRMGEYTAPGYERYGRFLVQELKPLIDRRYRTRRDPAHTAVMGSSLGGVVSFYLGWQHPDVFGAAGCLSSTFGYRDDLMARVRRERRPSTRFYLDSGYPRDNFEATRAMRAALIDRGAVEGQDLLYFGFPEARHSEKSWAMRAHLPLQFFFGQARGVEPSAG